MPTLSAGDVVRVLLAITLLLIGAHCGGYLFARFHQPRVIGEILGGLALGPTLLGVVAPGVEAHLFPTTGEVPLALDGLAQLGLLLLMFGAGAEMRSSFRADERRTVATVALTGIALPAAVGFAFVSLLPPGYGTGTANSRPAFVLVFVLAIAVTSIPVISRIMFDLGILETPFARIVLTVAVLEDVIVYVVLAVAVGLVAASSGDAIGLPAVLGIRPGSDANVVFHVVATLAFLAVTLLVGPAVYRALAGFRFNLIRRGNEVAFQLVFMLLLTVGAGLLGVTPMFGACMAGIIVGTAAGETGREERASINAFSFAFFIPIYFAMVGLKLDLVHAFSPVFFLIFLAIACAAKFCAVWVGARVAGESPRASTNLGVALNARGGPGIVLASTAFAAGIVDESFYAVLVMLAIVTSLIAGSWLGAAVRRGEPLRGRRPDAETEGRPLGRPAAREEKRR